MKELIKKYLQKWRLFIIAPVISYFYCMAGMFLIYTVAVFISDSFIVMLSATVIITIIGGFISALPLLRINLSMKEQVKPWVLIVSSLVFIAVLSAFVFFLMTFRL